MPPKVSVLMITYNQEQYIGQAIESILAQQVNFAYELVIGEDCSTDDTRAICQAYQKKHPEIIRLLEHEHNLGMAGNFFATLRECRGQYLAILEGDDFWVNPLKLQKQAEFLDANPGFSIVFGKTQTFYQEDGRLGQVIPPLDASPYCLENLLRTNFIATCSVMYRSGLVQQYPSWLWQMEMLDWPMHVLHAQHGSIGFLDELVAKYRIHAKSNYSSRKAILNYKGMLSFYQQINRHLGFVYSRLIYKLQMNLCNSISHLSAAENNKKEALYYQVLFRYYQLLFHLPDQVLPYVKAV